MRWIRAISGSASPTAAAVTLLALPVGAAVAQEQVGAPLFIAVAGVGGAMSTLTIAYPVDPGVEQAKQDVAALAAAGQWTVSTPDRAETKDGVLYEAQITPAVTLDAAGQVPIFPFLSAFRRFPRIRFGFVGEAAGAPGKYHDENRYVAAEWNRAGRSVVFEFLIKDPSFETAEDVRLTDRPANQPLPAPAGGVGVRPRTAHLWVLLLVGSIGTGVFVWGLTWWALTRREAPVGAAKEEKPGSEAKQRTPDDAGPREGVPPG
jgi:hypothetical protein